MYRLAARQNDNTGNLLNLPTDDGDQASAASSPSPTLPAHRTSTVYVKPSKEATTARHKPATTVQVTHTVTAGAKSNTGVLVAAALVPFLVAGIVAAGFFFWLRRKRNTRSVYNVEAFNAATRDGDPSTPPTSPNKLKAYMMEKASQTKSKKKSPLQYHPDLETQLSGIKPRSDAANNNGEQLQADDVPHIRIRLSTRNGSSSSRPKPTPIQPSSGPFGPSQMRHPSALVPTKARPPQKPRGDKPLAAGGTTDVSPADLYKASKKQKGSRKMQQYEARSNKTQSLVSIEAQSVVSTGSTLVLPVIKPVQSIKRKPVPKELDLSLQSKASNKAFRPPSSAGASSFAKKKKHSTAMTQSSFYCQGDTSPAGAQPDSSPENTSSGDSGVLPTPGHVHRFSTLDQVGEEHDAPTLDAIQDLVQEMEMHPLSDSGSSTSHSQRGVQLRGSIIGGMSVASVQSGMSYDAYGVPVPPPSLASASS